MPAEHSAAPPPKPPKKPPKSVRIQVARIGAYESWAKTADRRARTLPARTAFDARFERQVDPDGVMDPGERRLAAAAARSAYFSRLALKSAQTRTRRRSS